jgi:hypothetical protein
MSKPSPQLHLLPPEIVWRICDFLDEKSQYRLCTICSDLERLVLSHPHWFTSVINLNKSQLSGLTALSLLQRISQFQLRPYPVGLDLSGCHGITDYVISSIARQWGSHLSCLRLGGYPISDPHLFSVVGLERCSGECQIIKDRKAPTGRNRWPSTNGDAADAESPRIASATLSPSFTVPCAEPISLSSLCDGDSSMNFQELCLAHRFISPHSFSFLVKHPMFSQLKHLDLRNTGLEPDMFQQIMAKLDGQLITLKLMNTTLTPLCLVHLRHHGTSLQHLELWSCLRRYGTTLSLIEAALEPMHALKVLWLSGITFDSVDHLITFISRSPIRRIQSLLLDVNRNHHPSGMDLTSLSFQLFTSSPTFECLTELRLSSAVYITNQLLIQFLTNKAGILRVIDLRGCTTLTYQALGLIFHHDMPALTECFLHDMPQKQALWSNEFPKVLPQLRVLSLQNILPSTFTVDDVVQMVRWRCPRLSLLHVAGNRLHEPPSSPGFALFANGKRYQ